MTDAPIHAAAEAAGIALSWTDIYGSTHEVAPEVLRGILDALEPTPAAATSIPMVTAECDQLIALPGTVGPCQLQLEDGTLREFIAEPQSENRIIIPALSIPGYHTLLHPAGRTTIAVAPRRCWSVSDAMEGRRAWGLSAQLYSLYRPGDGGVGDFAALADLVRSAASHGASAVAISPIHAQFSAIPNHFSPYFPSSRAMLNVLYADAGISETTEPGAMVDWASIAPKRMAAYRTRFAAMLTDDTERLAFETFRAARGEALERHAQFETLHAAHPETVDWHQWPATFHDPANPEVARFMAAHPQELAFHAFLQFLADRGLADAQKTAIEAGMTIGLIADLAVGVASHGSDSWCRPGEMMRGLSIGAPPDMINPYGQDWGITSFSPTGLVAHGFQAFLETLRTALRHAGGVRIDHVMGLARLWVRPYDAPPGQGAYLRFPVDDLLRLVRLESWRHKAIVLGEDLGTLPDGFRERLENDGLAGMRVLWFERQGNSFVPPSHWHRSAVAMTSTHDLPTVAGWWSGLDLGWREQLGYAVSPEDHVARAADRDALWSAFRETGSADGPTPPPEHTEQAVDAACAHLGTAACDLALVPLEDVLALPEQPNLPGTIDEHPNWRRRLAVPAGTMLDDPAVAARLSAIARTRP